MTSSLISSDNFSELKEAIEQLCESFGDTANSYIFDAMHSAPPFSGYYLDLAEEYQQAATACFEYSKNLNFTEFLRQIKHLGFIFKIVKLKKYIEDPELLEEIFGDLL